MPRSAHHGGQVPAYMYMYKPRCAASVRAGVRVKQEPPADSHNRQFCPDVDGDAVEELLCDNSVQLCSAGALIWDSLIEDKKGDLGPLSIDGASSMSDLPLLPGTAAGATLASVAWEADANDASEFLAVTTSEESDDEDLWGLDRADLKEAADIDEYMYASLLGMDAIDLGAMGKVPRPRQQMAIGSKE